MRHLCDRLHRLLPVKLVQWLLVQMMRSSFLRTTGDARADSGTVVLATAPAADSQRWGRRRSGADVYGL
ncbi:hypothetical protein DF3PA_140036 [Candidatus Defluviicoccus seviourii]|uniref:Uncharacterized protein n=2 Tax=root TaxID=1 RepID=A0A564WAZ5_9PROT|nr:hypothetical protein DF3PB_1060002 [uncultured Defluviicoccus sp.]VUX45655.1 hypothetical protein DF3PA_140036 [Candidatus Defluviicoccus seviourii]